MSCILYSIPFSKFVHFVIYFANNETYIRDGLLTKYRTFENVTKKLSCLADSTPKGCRILI